MIITNGYKMSIRYLVIMPVCGMDFVIILSYFSARVGKIEHSLKVINMAYNEMQDAEITQTIQPLEAQGMQPQAEDIKKVLQLVEEISLLRNRLLRAGLEKESDAIGERVGNIFSQDMQAVNKEKKDLDSSIKKTFMPIAIGGAAGLTAGSTAMFFGLKNNNKLQNLFKIIAVAATGIVSAVIGSVAGAKFISKERLQDTAELAKNLPDPITGHAMEVSGQLSAILNEYTEKYPELKQASSLQDVGGSGSMTTRYAPAPALSKTESYEQSRAAASQKTGAFL